MDDKLIDRVFTELDTHSKRLVDLSEVVHANAAILGLVTKLVVAIIMFIVITSLGTLYNHFKTSTVLYHRQIAPIESDLTTYGITPDPPDRKNKGGK
jgi:hypothetical protein